MAFIKVDINYSDTDSQEIKNLLIDNNLKLEIIMAGIQDVLDGEVTLQDSVDAMQAKIAELEQTAQDKNDTLTAANAALQTKVDELQALVDAGATPEQFQAAVDGLKAIQADVDSTVTPVPAA